MNSTIERTRRTASPASPGPESSAHVVDETSPSPSQPNMAFLAGLAELLGRFESEDLQAHQPGLLLLINDAISGIDRGTDLVGPFPEDTSVVVIQRVASLIAR